jgi:hypothetical protein
MMQTGEVVADLTVLNSRFRLGESDELIARKQAGTEKTLLDERDLAAHGAALDRLEAALVEAHDASGLPEEPTTAAALDDLVVGLRLAAHA